MPSPYRASSPTITSATPSVVHASTSTIVQHEGQEFAIKLESEPDYESHFDASSDVSDDPRNPDPSHSKAQQPASLPFQLRPSADPNVVTWDGPNDPENPQNWSLWYRWWLTTVCTVMTLNVYVSHILWNFSTAAPDISSTCQHIRLFCTVISRAHHRARPSCPQGSRRPLTHPLPGRLHVRPHLLGARL
jgi:hypothetical protein